MSWSNNIWKIWLALLLALAIFSQLVSADGFSDSSAKRLYSLGETVTIKLDSQELDRYDVFIVFGSNEYRYLGALSKQIEFRPSVAGDYRLDLVDKESGMTIDSIYFAVLASVGTPAAGEVWTDKLRYQVGEKVIINTAYPGEEYELAIQYSGGQYRYFGQASQRTVFRPSAAGEYSILVKSAGVVIGSSTFTVDVPQEIVLQMSNKLPWGLGSIFNQKLKFESKDSQGNKKNLMINVMDESGKPVEYLTENSKYLFEVGFDSGPIERIKFHNLTAKQNLEIKADAVGRSKIGGISGNVLDAFAIDPSALDFDSAEVTKVAKGTVLYKCAEWDFTAQACLGDWTRLMDISPGSEYSFNLTPADPGFAEVGVATVNTDKSMYHTLETVKAMMVVLDSGGYLVSGADVQLTITNPAGTSVSFSTNESTIIEEERGIYSAFYTTTPLEGDYSLFVSAVGESVNNNMSSYFVVSDYYPFDILRQSPGTVDPWMGPFATNITLVSLGPGGAFNFTEAVPKNFTITDLGGAVGNYETDKILLTWTGLGNNSRVSYSSQPPLVTPDLYELGPGKVSYEGGEFTEARVWYLAIDPSNDNQFAANQSVVYNGSTIIVYGNYSNNERLRNYLMGILDDEQKINSTSCSSGAADFVCVSSSVISEGCSGTITGGASNCTWFLTDCRNGQAFRLSYVIRACSGNEETASSNILTSWANPATSGSFDLTASVTILDRTFVQKTVTRVGEDTSAPWASINQTPQVNLTLDENAYCRMSDSDEGYAEMADNVICSGGGTKSAVCVWNGNPLLIGNTSSQYDYLYVACNDTSGNADNTSTNIDITIQVLCDTHADCPNSQFCRNTQICTDDMLTGYNCAGEAYGGGNDDEVCGGGAITAKCVDDSSYSYTGWYCSLDSDDCVYNDNGNSYGLNYILCSIVGNDYKSCGASNTWSSWNYCADAWTGADKTATASTHTNYNCSYYVSDQSCSSGLSGGCVGSPTDCGAYVYKQDIGCGNTFADCDLGCGAECDVDNSTAPGIISGTCYYDKSCSIACSWSSNSEAAPSFCINDYDGGTCSVIIRTNPTNQDTCYWNPQCLNTIGANLSSAGGLRQDYCDYCDASGNHSGGYSPTPTSPCSTGCPNSGTIYYDSGGTYANRGDDCSAGSSTILTDTLEEGDVWDGNNLAYCDDAECDLDCGSLTGSCLGGAGGSCVCSDTDSPSISLMWPEMDYWHNKANLSFVFNVSDFGSAIQNCSLLIGGSVNRTILAPQEDIPLSLNQSFINGSYTWAVECYDNSPAHNKNTSETRSFGVDTTYPQLSSPHISGSSFSVNDYLCINITASDTFSGIDEILANIIVPVHPAENITLSDSVTTFCDGINGDGVYSAEYLLDHSGIYNWTIAFGNDSADNKIALAVGLSWNVSAAGNVSVSMSYPSADLTVNESDEMDYTFRLNCTAYCGQGLMNCSEVYIFPQYYDGSWVMIPLSGEMLASDQDSHYCGNLTINGNSCNSSFIITTGTGSGNNLLGIRCRGTSENSPTAYSRSVNLTINDHPYSVIGYPAPGSWVRGNVELDGSGSYDLDGSLARYVFEIDNSSTFASQGVVCDSSSDTCSLDTIAQGQCQDSVMGCYLRINVTDNYGLENSSSIMFGIDNSGPVSTIGEPANFTNITTGSYTLTATASDAGIGTIDTVSFYYSPDGSSWNLVCTDTSSPFSCEWDIAGLGLVDATIYQIRAYANDSLGNIGQYDTRKNITIDRNPPNTRLERPEVGNWSIGYVQFGYNVSDGVSEVRNCSLFVDGGLNETMWGIAQNVSYSFNSSFTAGGHSWRIECTDAVGNTNSSETRSFNVDYTGPAASIVQPPNSALISGVSYNLNASVADSGVGSISQVTFLYRVNSTADWQAACIDADGASPFSCSWSLSGLEDGDAYQVRVFANDTLNNEGNNDTRTGITIDNYGPSITILSPGGGETDFDGDLYFFYQVIDLGSGILNCSLYFNNTLNKTTFAPIVEGQTYNFSILNVSNGDYYWNISCFDDFSISHMNTTETRLVTVDRQYILNISLSKSKSSYEVGEEIGELTLFTTNVSDLSGQPLEASVTTDVIMGSTSQPWWDISWQRRRAISINETWGTTRNATVLVNATGLNPYIQSCNEIRVVENKSISQTEIPFQVIGGDGSTFCTFVFYANVSASSTNVVRYYVYYNNTAASAPSYSVASNGTAIYDYWDYLAKGHTAYSSSNVGTKPPTGGPTVTNEVVLTSTAYGQINRSDNTRASVSAAGFRAFRFQMKVAENITYIDRLNITWEGYTTRGTPYNLYVWNYTGSSWRDLGSATTTTTDANISAVIASGFSDLINSSGIINFVAETASSPNNQPFYTDYVKLQVSWDKSSGYQAATLNEEMLANRSVGQSGVVDGLWLDYWRATGQQTGNYTALSVASKTLYTSKKAYTDFEITNDMTGPNVTLNSPPPGSEVNASVTFTYIVNDSLSSTKNCTLYIDFEFEGFSPAVTEGVVQPFYPRIPAVGWHNWSVNCTDIYGNVGASEAWSIWVKPPDLTLYASEVNFSSHSLVEGENVTIFATIYNIGGSDAFNVTVQFWDGDWQNGTKIGDNITIENLTDPTLDKWNKTINVSWKPSMGPHRVFILIDPPLATNGSIFELNESNNYVSINYSVPTWHTYYGNATGLIVISDMVNQSIFVWNESSYANVYVAETGADISWTHLQAIGLNTSSGLANLDFEEIDASMNMTFANDSTYKLFTDNGVPKLKRDFNVYSTLKQDVPVINSTNSTTFQTGILWDYSDANSGEYNGTQDLVFISEISPDSQGQYGKYDYEIKVPAMLREYSESSYDTVSFYVELI